MNCLHNFCIRGGPGADEHGHHSGNGGGEEAAAVTQQLVDPSAGTEQLCAAVNALGAELARVDRQLVEMGARMGTLSFVPCVDGVEGGSLPPRAEFDALSTRVADLSNVGRVRGGGEV